MSSSVRVVALVAALALLPGCASLAPGRGYSETRELVLAHRDTAPDLAAAAQGAARSELPQTPIDVAQAVELAFRNSPRLQQQLARIGLGRAALEQARRLPNPRLGFSRLHGDGGSEHGRSVGFGLGDVLLLPLRRRLAEAEFERMQLAVAHELLALAADVEVAWYTAAAAQQVAAMRELVARAGRQAATLAQRFFDAGNIDRLQLERELAASAEARIDAARAQAAALRARGAFADLVGLPLDADWQLQTGLPAPSAWRPEVDGLWDIARERRLDLAAIEAEVALRDEAFSAARRWRWLGDIELGFERERESDGTRMRGPTLEFELPIFDQGQGEVARSGAERFRARAAADARMLAARNEIRSGVERVRIAAEIVDRYRLALLPHREAVVARTQERVNFMLAGVFELIQARQSGYDAYQEYLEAVRDYWIAVAELRRAVGGELPGAVTDAASLLGIDAVLPSPADERGGHDEHMHGHGDAAPASENDPHAAHRAHGDAKRTPHEAHGAGAHPPASARGHEHGSARDAAHDPHEMHESDRHPEGHEPRRDDGGARDDESNDPHAHHDHGDRP